MQNANKQVDTSFWPFAILTEKEKKVSYDNIKQVANSALWSFKTRKQGVKKSL